MMLQTAKIKNLFLFCFFIAMLTAGCMPEKPQSTEENILPEEYTAEEFNSLIFTGAQGKASALFKYYPAANKIEEFWKSKGEKILEFSYSPDRSSAFFITARSIRRKAAFPSIKNLKLYVINNDSTVKLVEEMEEAAQVFAKWETNSAFRILINRMDPDNASLITQKSRIFNTYGKLFEEEERLYNLLTDGYPYPSSEELKYISPGNKYRILAEEGKRDSLFLLFSSSGKKYLITETDKMLRNISWSPDLMYAVVELTDTADAGEGSDLLVYSIKEKKTIERWNANNPGNHFIVNDLLVFDRGRENKSSIIFYKLDERKAEDTISMKGGSSLRTILY